MEKKPLSLPKIRALRKQGVQQLDPIELKKEEANMKAKKEYEKFFTEIDFDISIIGGLLEVIKRCVIDMAIYNVLIDDERTLEARGKFEHIANLIQDILCGIYDLQEIQTAQGINYVDETGKLRKYLVEAGILEFINKARGDGDEDMIRHLETYNISSHRRKLVQNGTFQRELQEFQDFIDGKVPADNKLIQQRLAQELEQQRLEEEARIKEQEDQAKIDELIRTHTEKNPAYEVDTVISTTPTTSSNILTEDNTSTNSTHLITNSNNIQHIVTTEGNKDSTLPTSHKEQAWYKVLLYYLCCIVSCLIPCTKIKNKYAKVNEKIQGHTAQEVASSSLKEKE